jgi:hypothetical protein
LNFGFQVVVPDYYNRLHQSLAFVPKGAVATHVGRVKMFQLRVHSLTQSWCPNITQLLSVTFTPLQATLLHLVTSIPQAAKFK